MKNKLTFFSSILILTLLISCKNQPKELADSIWYNGTILTMESENPDYVEAVAVKDGKILEVGTLAQINKLKGDSTQAHDLAGQTLLPGFIEPHLHPMLATILIQTEIIAFNDWSLPHGEFKGVRDQAAYFERLDSAVAKHNNPAKPFISWGFHELYHGNLDRVSLDIRYGEKPVAIWQYSFHEMILNTAAIKFLDIDEELAEKHPQVDLAIGRFFELGMQQVLAPKLFPYTLNPKNALRGMQLTAQTIHKGGVTTVADMAMPFMDLNLELNLLQQALGKKNTPFRTYLIPRAGFFLKNPAGLEAAFPIIDNLNQHDSDKIKFLKHIKLLADGSFFAQMMKMKDPYTDGHEGAWLTTPEDLKKYAQFFWNKDYRVHVHVNGDLGVETVLNTLEKLIEENPRENHRFTLHHLGYITENQVKRMAKLGAVGSVQPYYVYGIGSKYAEHGLGAKRAQRISPIGNLIENDIVTCFHSDFFMAPVEPLTLMWIAVNRTTIDGKIFGKELRISTWEALKAVTINAAHHLNQEDFIGSIKAGKSADFVILDKNPLKAEPEDINQIKVLKTVFEGRLF